MMHGYDMGSFFGWGFLQLILIILLITFLFWVFNKSNESKMNSSEDQSIKILNERLARGEITVEEYDRLKRKINS
ncbi:MULTISPECIES: SHOCT domain-containing protein [Allobacillus]|nr:SHOCT domain-containing protein [Allobacillus salarius]